jgi:hypothetical protein
MLSETKQASTLDCFQPWHGFTALEYKRIQENWISIPNVYTWYIPCICQLLEYTWHIHIIYMVYTCIYILNTWYIPCMIFLLVPDDSGCWNTEDSPSSVFWLQTLKTWNQIKTLSAICHLCSFNKTPQSNLEMGAAMQRRGPLPTTLQTKKNQKNQNN